MIRAINKYLEEKAPWKTVKEFPNQNEITATTLYVSIECIRICTQLLNPIMPSKTRIVLDAMGVEEGSNNLSYGVIKPQQTINSITTLFPKKDK